jgi:serine/threonine-protein kinase
MPESQLDLLSSADLPLRLGRYELQSILGEGGMARVFGAELLGPAGFRKLVAVKVIKSEAIKQANSVEVEGFIREARLGGLLKHPNIVDVYELGDTEGQLFIAMELVEGQTLYQLIGGGEKPPAAVVLEIASGIAAGLASAHSLSSEGLPAGLVHRDMKPSNVLVSWEGCRTSVSPSPGMESSRRPSGLGVRWSGRIPTCPRSSCRGSPSMGARICSLWASS